MRSCCVFMLMRPCCVFMCVNAPSGEIPSQTSQRVDIFDDCVKYQMYHVTSQQTRVFVVKLMITKRIRVDDNIVVYVKQKNVCQDSISHAAVTVVAKAVVNKDASTVATQDTCINSCHQRRINSCHPSKTHQQLSPKTHQQLSPKTHQHLSTNCVPAVNNSIIVCMFPWCTIHTRLEFWKLLVLIFSNESDDGLHVR